MRLIDANDFRYKLQCEHIPSDSLSASTVNNMIADAPTVDAVPVVRCVNCKNHGNCDIEDIMREICRKSYSDLFCPDGERKDGAPDA